MAEQEQGPIKLELDEQDNARVEELYNKLKECKDNNGHYHVRLKDTEDIDLYFISTKDIAILWKKFNSKNEPPTIRETEPDPESDDYKAYKETWIFKIYDPEQDKEGFIEFTSMATVRTILTFLNGDEENKVPKTNFLHIVRVGEGKATRYGVKPAQ